MSARSVLILERHGGSWVSFLRDYFNDTPVAIVAAEEPSQAAAPFAR